MIDDNQPLFQNVDISGIGDGAYFNKGGDAPQLWVKLEHKIAFVVGFGDVPNEEAAKASQSSWWQRSNSRPDIASLLKHPNKNAIHS